jgi:ribosome-binding factor A
MSSHRLLRVRELLKRQIGEAVRRELPVDQAGIVTVNDVEISSDLRHATVYIGMLGSDEQQRTGLLLLRQNRSRFQEFVAKSVVLKYTPHLRFVADDSVRRGNRVLEIISELEKSSSDSSTDSP